MRIMSLALACLAGLWFIAAPVGIPGGETGGRAGVAWAADNSATGQAPDAKSSKDAGASTNLGSFGDWQAKTMPQQGVTLCYISSTPQNDSPAFADRGQTALLVTHAEKGMARDQVSVILGFEPRKGTAVSLKIGKRSFTLQKITGDRAWSSSDSQDKLIVAAMKKNDYLSLRATTSKGRTGEDRYSLSGFSAAYDKITAACGL